MKHVKTLTILCVCYIRFLDGLKKIVALPASTKKNITLIVYSF